MRCDVKVAHTGRCTETLLPALPPLSLLLLRPHVDIPWGQRVQLVRVRMLPCLLPHALQAHKRISILLCLWSRQASNSFDMLLCIQLSDAMFQVATNRADNEVGS